MSTTRRFAMPAAVLLVSVLMAAAAAAQGGDDTLIVPGQRIGRFSLESLVRELGSPGFISHCIGTCMIPIIGIATRQYNMRSWFFEVTAVTVYTRDDLRIELLELSHSGNRPEPALKFHTDKGIGWGASRTSVEQAYGQPTWAAPPLLGTAVAAYDPLGIAFRYEADMTTGIYVFRPGSAPKRPY